MAVPFNRPPRDDMRVGLRDIRQFVLDLSAIANETKTPLSEVIEAARVLEMRRATDVHSADLDARDEDWSGFAAILRGIQGALRDLADASDGA